MGLFRHGVKPDGEQPHFAFNVYGSLHPPLWSGYKCNPMNANDTSRVVTDRNTILGANAGAPNGNENVVIGYQASTRDDRGTIVGCMSIGTNSAGAALGDHIKVGNSCVSVGSYSNTAYCYMGIAIGYQSDTSNASEEVHTNTAYSFCAGMGSRIKGAFCVGIGRGISIESACGHSIVLGAYARSEVPGGIVLAGGQGSGPAPVTATAAHPVWLASPELASGEMMLGGQPFYDFSTKKLNPEVMPMDDTLQAVGRLLVNLGLDEKRTMDMVAALIEELAAEQQQKAARRAGNVPAKRIVPLEPYELEEQAEV